MKIDAFAHVLPVGLLKELQQRVPDIIEQNPFLKIPALTDLKLRRENFPADVKQIISNVNLNPEDYVDSETAGKLCVDANDELLQLANYKFNPNKPGIFQWQSVDDVFLMVVD